MMAAAFLSKNFPQLKITMLESKKIGTIGVGESSTASLIPFIRVCGLKDHEWLNEVSACFKYGGRFINWSPSGDHFVLVENESKLLVHDNLNLTNYLVSEKRNEPEAIKDIFLTEKLARANRSPYFTDELPYEPKSGFLASPISVNFDARKLADILRDKCVIPNGVTIISDDLKEVKLDDAGFITQLKTVGKHKISADLYIDCSGFRSALIETILEEPFVSFEDSLFCDRALALPIPYTNKAEQLLPYTTMTTMSSGWMWSTPIFDRIGSGYVYSSKYISDEDAEKEFRTAINYHDGEVLKLKMRVGTRNRVAVKNVVACGLSGGFAEPMESTGISTFQGILATLGAELESTGLNYDRGVMDRINADNIDMMIDIRDFIVAHYILCHRNDTPFWKDVHEKTVIPDTLHQKLEILKQPMGHMFRGRIFGSINWFQWLWGCGFYKDTDFKLTKEEIKFCEHRMNVIKTEGDSLVDLLPSTYEFLKNKYNRD